MLKQQEQAGAQINRVPQVREAHLGILFKRA